MKREIVRTLRELNDGDAIEVISDPAQMMEVRWRLGLQCSDGVVAITGVLRKDQDDKAITAFLEYGCAWDRLPLTRRYYRRVRGSAPIYKTAVYQHVIKVTPLDPAQPAYGNRNRNEGAPHGVRST